MLYKIIVNAVEGNGRQQWTLYCRGYSGCRTRQEQTL